MAGQAGALFFDILQWEKGLMSEAGDAGKAEGRKSDQRILLCAQPRPKAAIFAGPTRISGCQKAHEEAKLGGFEAESCKSLQAVAGSCRGRFFAEKAFGACMNFTQPTAGRARPPAKPC
jgi:hypothetical protein